MLFVLTNNGLANKVVSYFKYSFVRISQRYDLCNIFYAQSLVKLFTIDQIVNDWRCLLQLKNHW